MKPLLSRKISRQPTVQLSEADVQSFHENGFLVVNPITTEEEIAQLRQIFRHLFAEKVGREQGAQFDMVGTDDDDAPARSPQIINPQFFAPELTETLFSVNCLAIARHLLGPRAELNFQHAILKPAGYGAPTPWHQDEAFRRDYPPGYQEISIWMPLQPVGPLNGCMEFLPKTHTAPVLPHRSPEGNVRVHTLECAAEIEETKAVCCPLPLGAASVHHCRTLHHAGPNQSSEERLAYIIGLQVPPTGNPRNHPDFSWNEGKQTANTARKRAWRRRGGVFVEVRRKFAKRVQNFIRRF